MAVDLSGKTCLITGATSGLGLEAAVVIARMGATTVITARDAKKAERVLQDIRTRSGSTRVSCIMVDFESQQSIRHAAAEFRASHQALHILVNNAGVVNAKRELTVDGYEKTFAVNHLGYFLLTNLLLDLIEASAPARIVNVSSEGHRRTQINFDDLQMEHDYQIMRAYGQSKLANILFTSELARRLKDRNVTANSLHPGAVATGIWARAPLYAKPLIAMAKLFFLSPAQAADTLVYLATSPDVEGLTGRYFVKNQPVRSSRASQDEATAKRLWDVSEQLTGLAAKAAA